MSVMRSIFHWDSKGLAGAVLSQQYISLFDGKVYYS